MFRFGALYAASGQCVLRWGQDVPSFPHAPFLARGTFPSLRSGQIFVDEAEHFLHNRDASVAALRWCSGSSRNAVRLPFEISVRRSASPESSLIDHLDDILNDCRLKVRCGVVEAISNIKSTLRRGRGYKNLRYPLLKAERMAVIKTDFVVFRKAAQNGSRHSWAEPICQPSPISARSLL
jgi:hypothetical protein